MSNTGRRPLRVAVVGAGIGGCAAALLLHRDGHDVTVVEQPAADRPHGAGLMVQQLGQQVLEHLGLLEKLIIVSAVVTGVDGEARSGRPVMRFDYGDVLPGAYGLGVHRGRLRGALAEAVTDAGIAQTTATVTGSRVDSTNRTLLINGGREQLGAFDLVVGADGTNSVVRRDAGLTRRDHPYPWGAVWSVVDDPEGISGDKLVQRYDGTRVTLGFLPVGSGQSTIFWSAQVDQLADLCAKPERLIALAEPHAGERATLVHRVLGSGLLPAYYRDVVARSACAPHLALIGDAAHATSPQLGSGASMALADAWTLATMLRRHAHLDNALDAYAVERRAHVRYYRWLSRMLTPVFQSRIAPLGPIRDRAIPLAQRVPFVQRQMVTMLAGVRTSPFGTWSLPQ
jgi:2-polyprenyl-6-methoxyphenol hydroxylase-like FAD-dependent oxidoreductase